jgi:protein-tyrosine phosphatase
VRRAGENSPVTGPVGDAVAFQDVGGHLTVDGRSMRIGSIYRISGSLVDDDELDTVARLGLRTLVDLRAADEDRQALIDFSAEHAITYFHLPMQVARLDELAAVTVSYADARALVASIYLQIVRDHGPTLASAIGALNSPLPAAFGCAAGKDRTGVLSAFLQRVLGVDEQTVIAEYIRCAPNPTRVRERLLGLLPAGVEPGPGLDVLVAAAPDALLAALHEAEAAHGSIEGYLRAMGLAADTIDGLRVSLLEDVQSQRGLHRAANRACDVG